MRSYVATTLELESVLSQLIAEHKRLLTQMNMQQEAMRRWQLETMEDATHAQEATRLRIAVAGQPPPRCS